MICPRTALILGIDRFRSGARIINNTVGNAAVTVVIAKYEKGLDQSILYERLGMALKKVLPSRYNTLPLKILVL